MQCWLRPNPPTATRNFVTKKCSLVRVVQARATPGPSITLRHEEQEVPAAAFHPRLVLCSKGDPNHLGPNGPKLLPRPVRPQSDGSSKKIGGGGSGGGGSGGGKGPGAMAHRNLATLAAYTGLIGTTAIVLGKLAGIDIWGSFHWESLDDLKLAAAASVPLQLLNAALLLPSYSSQKELPDLSKLEDLEANHGKEEEPCEKPQEPTGSAGAAAATAAAAAPQPPMVVSAAEPSRIGLVPAGLWGRSREGSAKREGEDFYMALRSALHLAQGHYLSNNPTARLTIAMEAAYTLLTAAAVEMLRRGVVLTWLATWLEDRVYEAGVDELLSHNLPEAAAALGIPSVSNAMTTLGVYGTCECAISAAIAALLILAVTSRSRRAVKRLELLMSVTSSSSSSTSTSSSGRSSAGGPSGAGGGGAGGKNPSRGNSSMGGGDARSAAAARAAAEVLFGPGGPKVGASSAATVMRRAAAIQASRDAFQVLLLDGIFIASGGNLAASYTASVINQLLISAMQRRGVQRLRERSAALARELRAYNAQMQRIAKKHKDKLPQEVAARLEDEDPLAEASMTAATPTTPTPTSVSDVIENVHSAARSSDSSNGGAAETASDGSSGSRRNSTSTEGIDGGSGTGSGSGSSTTSSSASGGVGSNVRIEGVGPVSETHDRLDSLAAASTSLDSVAAAKPATSVIVDTADVQGSTSNRDPVKDRNSSLGRALAVLDMLVPEPSTPIVADRKLRPQKQSTPQIQEQQR